MAAIDHTPDFDARHDPASSAEDRRAHRLRLLRAMRRQRSEQREAEWIRSTRTVPTRSLGADD